jgi:putative flippase GtrA
MMQFRSQLAKLDVARLLRFLLVGGMATLSYALLVTLANLWLPLPAGVNSLIAYGLSMPVSYVGHRLFTFHSSHAHGHTAPRFILTSIAGYGLAFFIPFVMTDTLGLSSHLATLASCIVIPGANFILLSLFVFGGRRDPANA